MCMLPLMHRRVQVFILAAAALLSACQTQARGSFYRPAPRPAQVQSPPARTGAGLIQMRPLAQPTTPAPAPNCAAVCVIDPRTGRVLYQYNAHVRRQVASTQKLVTALCVLDAGNLRKMVTIQPQDEAVPPCKLNLKPGTSYRRGDLLRAMLTGSYNDVALTLARDTAGSVDAFVNRMNARARRMRMFNTHFANPNGLPAQQYSTAYDMALAACYAYNSPQIRLCVNTPEYKFRMADGSLHTIKSTNKLLKQYPWVHGMKTGFTNAAGKCLISCASMHGSSVIVVVLGSTNLRVWGESLKYLRWAFGRS